MLQISQISQSPFKSFIENDPILYALIFNQMRWGDIEDAEDAEDKDVKEDKELFENFVII